MTPLITISAIAIIYSLIRAKHDSYLYESAGNWKAYAFIEGIFIAVVVCALTVYAFRLCWFQIFGLTLSFAFIFWIVFDCTIGLLREGDMLYIGNTGWDKKARQIWKYDLPIFGWKSRGLIYLLWKLFVAGVVVIPSTIHLLLTYR